jgi:glutamate-1-semialdehyde 2,1-aminomutase
MAAALETLRLIRETDYLSHIETLGTYLANGLSERAAAYGLGLRVTGPVQMPLFLFDDDPDLRMGFHWSSQMLAQGAYVHPWHNMFLCAAMGRDDMDHALNAADVAFKSLKQHGPSLQPVAKMAFLTGG